MNFCTEKKIHKNLLLRIENKNENKYVNLIILVHLLATGIKLG